MNPNLTFSVSEYIAALNAALKTLEAKIVGEVIKVTKASSGHVYFTMKDKEKDAVIDCVIWAHQYRLNAVRLETGMKILITGSAQLYAPTGRLSFHTKTIELVGEGALKKAYEKLKSELAEGLLSDARKRNIPQFPHRIGVITSKQGAVIHDFSNNLGRWGFEIKFVDSRVEGKEALYDLLNAMNTLKKQHIDVLVIMRGGGSMQSLAAFDNAAVVRAVAEFPVPVIAAIGHHQDVPLTALVADHAPSTPTAAAHLVSASWDQAEKTLDENVHSIVSGYQTLIHSVTLTLQLRREGITEKFAGLLRIFNKASDQIQKAITRVRETAQFHAASVQETHARLASVYAKTLLATKTTLTQSTKYHAVFSHTLTDTNTYLTHFLKDISLTPSLETAHHYLHLQWEERVTRSYMFVLEQRKSELEYCEKIVRLNDPRRLLKHGYSILKHGQRLVKSIEDVTIGDSAEIMVADGTIQSTISATKSTKHTD